MTGFNFINTMNYYLGDKTEVIETQEVYKILVVKP